MTDGLTSKIVSRLRAYAGDNPVEMPKGWQYASSLMSQAADEIERLTKDRDEWKHADTDRCAELFHVRELHGNALSENERLRAALKACETHDYRTLIEAHDAEVGRLRAALEDAGAGLREFVEPYLGARGDHVPPFIQRAVTVSNGIYSALARGCLETEVSPVMAKHKCECGKSFITVEVFDHHQECCPDRNQTTGRRSNV
jgi:hypothetical protein